MQTPEVSRFFGVIISINYRDHPPDGEQRALIGIQSLSLLEGNLSPRLLGMVIEWAILHRQELLDTWELARKQQPLRAIEPLE